jgi:adenosylmethionine-8-amino-7-oxononanoate aminotransferase
MRDENDVVADVPSAQQLLEWDRQHVWHPYASMPPPSGKGPYLIEAASGVRLRVIDHVGDAREVVDGMSSWWAAIHGYRHPIIDAALQRQAARMSHVMFGGLTHEPAIQLARTLVSLTPEPLQHVFFADSGSVAVEVAIKMCLQYWRSQGQPAKRRLLTWRRGYYGDTWHAMSVGDPDNGMHALWGDALPRHVFADAPPAQFDENYVGHLAALVDRHAHELAAIIVEPIAQNAGGLRFHSAEYLRVLRELTTKHRVLLIFDEIATGFGRTGELFAADHAGVSPDVMCVGKALTGGYISLAATLCTADLANGISAGEVPVLAHGPTFMGNPLATAVANASIAVLLDQDWRHEVKRIKSGLATGLNAAWAIDGVRDVRTLGAIGVVQLDHDIDVAAATRAAMEKGVWLRPFRDLIYTMPAYVTSDDDLAMITDAILAAAQAGVRD